MKYTFVHCIAYLALFASSCSRHPAVDDILDQAETLLSDSDELKRANASFLIVSVWGQTAGPSRDRAINLFTRGLRDDHPLNRHAFAYALCQAVYDKQAPDMPRAFVDPIQADLLTDNKKEKDYVDHDMKINAIFVMGPDSIPYLKRLYAKGDDVVRHSAIRRLILLLPENPGVTGIVRSATEDSDPFIAWEARSALE
ncbi:MAG: hypothetical protein AAF591_09690 [Verrucomicrobiota bacterium]